MSDVSDSDYGKNSLEEQWQARKSILESYGATPTEQDKKDFYAEMVNTSGGRRTRRTRSKRVKRKSRRMKRRR